MNREQRCADNNERARKNKEPVGAGGVLTTSPNRKAVTVIPRQLILCATSILVVIGVILSALSVKTASGLSAKTDPLPKPSPIVSSKYAVTAAIAKPPAIQPFQNEPYPVGTSIVWGKGVIDSQELKVGDTVWRDKSWVTITKIDGDVITALPAHVSSPHAVLEADIKIDLSESNGGRTFNVGRISACSELVVRKDGGVTTAGDLKVGDRIRMSGSNIGRVTNMTKQWHTPTPTKYDKNGIGFNRIIAKTERMTDRLLYLYTSVELIKTTPNHPFAVKGKGYVIAERLQPGDTLES